MAKTPKTKVAKSVNSTTKPTAKRKPKSAPAGHVPVAADEPCTCCPDCNGKPSGTMGACEDNVCRDIPPPPAGAGPWVLFWKVGVNGNFPYWEDVANIGRPDGPPNPATKPPEPPPA